MKKFKVWLAKHLRYFADRIDYEHAFVLGPGTFKIIKYKDLVFEEGQQISPEPEGVQLWYRVDEYAAKRETWE